MVIGSLALAKYFNVPVANYPKLSVCSVPSCILQLAEYNRLGSSPFRTRTWPAVGVYHRVPEPSRACSRL